jgi:hypothetical protein
MRPRPAPELARGGTSLRWRPVSYTGFSPGRYPWQWYWDSGFAAIAWRHFDPTDSELELRSLLAAQREDGFIGHTIFWNEPLSGWRRFTYNVTSADATMTASIQPPLLAWAWRIAVGDPVEEPPIARHHAWLAEHRDLDGDGLLWIVQPDESGLDASTQFDAIWGDRAHGLAAFPLLVQRNRRLGYDLRRIAAAGAPICCEVTTNVLYQRRYWRGPTWIITAWLCWLGLVRLGYEEQADQLSERVAGAVAGARLREYYNPHSGAGMGARDFVWSSLVLEMTQGDRELASSSFLKRSS